MAVPPGPGKPTVKFAVYGGLKNGNQNGGWKTTKDVTDALQKAINDSGDETAKIDNKTMGVDPAHLVPKQFGALLKMTDGSERAFACLEGQTIDFTS